MILNFGSVRESEISEKGDLDNFFKNKLEI